MNSVQPESNFTLFTSEQQLISSDKMLLEKAKEAAKNAYAPYSHFYVGAALELENGQILTANNQENAAFPSGLCAERVLLFNTGANYSNAQIKTISVVALKNNAVIAATPCGSCRQVMVEYEQKQKKPFRVIMYKARNEILISNDAKSLLPFAFDAKSLLNK